MAGKVGRIIADVIAARAINFIDQQPMAINVHPRVSIPGAFPSQRQEPYIMVGIILWALIIIKKGDGIWSMDYIHSSM